MKICGTVRRPLRAIISSRSFGPSFTSISRNARLFFDSKRARSLTVRTPPGQVDDDVGRAHFEPGFEFDPLASGRLSLIQEFNPPSRLNTLVKPSLVKVRAAVAPLTPLSQ
jgi:hypothetical protein